MYKKEGLEQTEEMKQTLEDIQSDNDSLSCFIKDELKEYNPIKYELVGAKKTLSDVYDRYANYEINNYHTPEDHIISFKKFVKCVRAKGFHIERKWSINNNRKELFITDWCLNEEIKTRKEIKTEESEGGGGGTDDKQ